MTNVPGGVCAPAGFRASGVVAHIKSPNSTKKDCALIVSEVPAAVAGMFTSNRLKAPSVLWNQGICKEGCTRAVFANSGNANACTGEPGKKDTEAIANSVAKALGVNAREVCVMSTGVIGVPLPMDRIEAGVQGCTGALSAEGSPEAALAIMTTDTKPKEMALEVPLEGGTTVIGAIAKGSGMIAPNMATMLCAITTDANMEPTPLQQALKECVQDSFNCICVDNDMSTSDTVLCLANGQNGLPPIAPDSADYAAFAKGLREVCIQTAQALVRDGEGATKFVEISVEGTRTDGEARCIARSIAVSQLCKTAFFGQDPNWGRIACAAGYAGVEFDPAHLRIALDNIEVVSGGTPADFEEEHAAAVMQRPEFAVRVSVGGGSGKGFYWTSDLSHDYVTINADYRT